MELRLQQVVGRFMACCGVGCSAPGILVSWLCLLSVGLFWFSVRGIHFWVYRFGGSGVELHL